MWDRLTVERTVGIPWARKNLGIRKMNKREEVRVAITVCFIALAGLGVIVCLAGLSVFATPTCLNVLVALAGLSVLVALAGAAALLVARLRRGAAAALCLLLGHPRAHLPVYT